MALIAREEMRSLRNWYGFEPWNVRFASCNDVAGSFWSADLWDDLYIIVNEMNNNVSDTDTLAVASIEVEDVDEWLCGKYVAEEIAEIAAMLRVVFAASGRTGVSFALYASDERKSRRLDATEQDIIHPAGH